MKFCTQDIFIYNCLNYVFSECLIIKYAKWMMGWVFLTMLLICICMRLLDTEYKFYNTCNDFNQRLQGARPRNNIMRSQLMTTKPSSSDSQQHNEQQKVIKFCAYVIICKLWWLNFVPMLLFANYSSPNIGQNAKVNFHIIFKEYLI